MQLLFSLLVSFSFGKIESTPERLTYGFRLLDHFGQSDLTAGFFTARENEQTFWTHNHGLHWEEIQTEDLFLIDSETKTWNHKDYKPSLAALGLSSAIYSRFPEVGAIIHSNSPSIMALAAMDKIQILPVSEPSFMFSSNTSYLHADYYFSDEYCNQVADALESDNYAVLVRNHALVVVGRTVEEAFLRAYMFDQTAKIQVLLANSPAHELSQKDIRAHENSYHGWYGGYNGSLEWPGLVRKIDRLIKNKDMLPIHRQKENLKMQRLGPHFGLKIYLSDLDDMKDSEILDLLWEHKLLVFSEQELTREAFQQFARRFGPLMDRFGSGYYPQDDNLWDVHVIEFNETHPPHLNQWHSDHPWRTFPSDIEFVYMEEKPEFGGDTVFTDASLAFQNLSPQMRSFIKDLDCEQTLIHGYGGIGLSAIKLDEMNNRFPPVVHPCVVSHHSTNQSLIYINFSFTSKIVGLSSAEDKAIREMILAHLERPEFQVRYNWSVGDLLLWDNWSLQHYALADYSETRRLIHSSRAGTKIPQRNSQNKEEFIYCNAESVDK